MVSRSIIAFARIYVAARALTDDDSDDGDHVRDVDDSVAVDVSSTKGALREVGQTQNGVGQGDQIQNADLAVAVDISRDERAACRRWRE